MADDPIQKLLLELDPVSGAPMASQPTISRFENGARRSVLYRMGRELAASVIERHRRRLQGRARRITIDLDPTDDLTHGAQQLTFFNGHYGGWCYLPMLGFLSFDREAEQYLCAAVLRPGNAVAANGTLGLLCQLVPLLRAALPRARFLVRLHGGFATPEIFDFLDAEPRLDYVVAMAKNAVLQRHAESAMQVARAQSEVGGETAHVYTDTRYAARTWGHERRVVIKAEVVRLGDREPRDNPRFVVTNLRHTPRFIYEKVYCARGDIENRLKELLDGPQIVRSSCCLFTANQMRVFLTAAAYVLMQELRLRATRTACARSQVTWLRERLLKQRGSTSSARSATKFCICRARRRTSRRGGTSHSRWAREPDSPPVAPRLPASWAAWAAPPAGLTLPNPRVRHAPPVGCSNPGSACRRRCPRPIPAPLHAL